MEEKVTKNIITREKIISDLTTENKVATGMSLVVFISVAVVGTGISALFLNMAFGDEVYMMLTIPVIFAAVIIFDLVMLIDALKERSLLLKGEFEIKEMVLSGKSESYYKRAKYAFHFEGYKKVLVNKNIFESATYYDKFYIVHYKNRKNIKLVYNASINEYRER